MRYFRHETPANSSDPALRTRSAAGGVGHEPRFAPALSIK
jgi:hypothetical protein